MFEARKRPSQHIGLDRSINLKYTMSPACSYKENYIMCKTCHNTGLDGDCVLTSAGSFPIHSVPVNNSISTGPAVSVLTRGSSQGNLILCSPCLIPSTGRYGTR